MATAMSFLNVYFCFGKALGAVGNRTRHHHHAVAGRGEITKCWRLTRLTAKPVYYVARVRHGKRDHSAFGWQGKAGSRHVSSPSKQQHSMWKRS